MYLASLTQERFIVAQNVEQYLISAVLKTNDHITPAARGITSHFFSGFEDEWKFIEHYISSHKRTPSRAAFLNKFPTFKFKNTDDVEHFCGEVRTAHAQTALTAGIQEIIADIDVGDIASALQTMHRTALETEAKLIGVSDDADIIDNWQDTFSEAMRRVARKSQFGQSGIPTGFPTLDERTGGPQPGHLWIVAARLGQGKTWSLVRMAAAAAFSGISVQYDALEGTRAEIAMRFHTFASSEYGLKVFKNADLTMGQNFSPREYKEFLKSLRNDVDGKMFIADTTRGPVSPLTIASQIERNKTEATYLDYITMMDTDNPDVRQGMVKLSKQLKGVAERYQTAIIAAAQLNRNAAGTKQFSGPEMLAESDSFGRDADAVITMVQLSKHVIGMKLVKFRHGRDGYVWYSKFLPNTGHFEEITFDQAQDVISEDKDSKDDEEGAYKFKPRVKGSFKNLQEGRNKFNSTLPKRKIVVKRK